MSTRASSSEQSAAGNMEWDAHLGKQRSDFAPTETTLPLTRSAARNHARAAATVARPKRWG